MPTIIQRISRWKNTRLIGLLSCAVIREDGVLLKPPFSVGEALYLFENYLEGYYPEPVHKKAYCEMVINLRNSISTKIANHYSQQLPIKQRRYFAHSTMLEIIDNMLRCIAQQHRQYNPYHLCDHFQTMRYCLKRLASANNFTENKWRHYKPYLEKPLVYSFAPSQETTKEMPKRPFPAHIRGLAEEIYDGKIGPEILCDALEDIGWNQDWLKKHPVHKGNWVLDYILGKH